MSWWITEIWQTISDKTPPCPTGRQQQDGGTVASSSLVLTRRKRNYSSSPFPHLQGCIMCTPPGLAPLYWRPWWQCFLGSTSFCWSDCLPVTLFEVEDLWTEAYLVRFPAHCESGIPQAHPLRALARFCKDPQVVYTQSRVCSTRIGGLWLSQNQMPNSMQGLLWFLDPLTHLYLTGMPGHPPQEFSRFNHRGWIQRWSVQFGLCLFLGQNRWVLKAITHWQWAESWWEDALDTIRLSAVASDGHVFAVLLGLLPSMGFDRWMDIQGSLPCAQRPLAQTWACGCLPSELSMPLTSHCGVGPCRLWTRSPPFIADDAWHCTSLQSPRRSYVSGHRDHCRPSETSYYACLWGSQGGDGKISCLDCSWRVDSYGGCYAWHCRKTANVGQCWSPPSCRHNHWLQGAASQSFWKGKTAYVLVLATVGCRWCPGLCPVPMACWNWCGLWTGWAWLPYLLEAELRCPRGSWSLSSCPPTYLGRLGGEWPIPQSHQPACTENHNLWVPTGSHPCNLLSLSYRVFAGQVPPWPVEWGGQVAWWHQTCCHYP